MIDERPEILSEIPLKNGDFISAQTFTQLVLACTSENTNSLALIAMAYDFQKGKNIAAQELHEHLIQLADKGVSVHVGLDYGFALHTAPHAAPDSSFPLSVARIRHPFSRRLRQTVRERKDIYRELQESQVTMSFHGRKPKLLPYANVDHRKILLIEGKNGKPNAAVIYGFSINHRLDDKNIFDGGVYINDPEAVEWIKRQVYKRHHSPSEKVRIGNFTFTTRELRRSEQKLADGEVTNTIRGAKHTLLFSGQFMPDGSILQELIAAANRGVEVSIVVNNPNLSNSPVYKVLKGLATIGLRRAIGSRYLHVYLPSKDDIDIHIKALVADADDPDNARAITGTDNMTNWFIQRVFKSREILVGLNNPDHVRRLQEYIRENILPNTSEYKILPTLFPSLVAA